MVIFVLFLATASYFSKKLNTCSKTQAVKVSSDHNTGFSCKGIRVSCKTHILASSFLFGWVLVGYNSSLKFCQKKLVAKILDSCAYELINKIMYFSRMYINLSIGS